MGSSAWVCFDCREAVRRQTYYRGDPLCPRCGKSTDFLGYKVPVPKKSDEKTWDELRSQLLEERYARQQKQITDRVRRKHEIEKQLTELESRSDYPQRARLIRDLQCELQQLAN